jgi:ATP-binding cassette subfamily B (MDR/TAP) protein 1
MFVCTYTYMLTWVYTGEVITKRIRERYLQATLRQNIAYFDSVGAGEVATRIQTDTREPLPALSH